MTAADPVEFTRKTSKGNERVGNDVEIAAIAAGVVLPIEFGDIAATTSFGELAVAESTPIVQLQFPYNINVGLVEPRANQSGVVDTNDNMARLQSGAAANSSGEILSVASVKYNPGQGGLCRFTALFTAGVANNEQIAGIGDVGNGYFLGYNGTEFSIFIRRSGLPEVRTLTVTTKSTDAEDITITLNSVAKDDVAVTDATAGDTTTTANDIAAADYSDVGRGWNAFAVGSTVIFVSWGTGTRTGTYTLSNAASAIGAFAQTLAGVAPVNSIIAQSSWNKDTCDGSGDENNLSGINCDFTKGQVFEIRYQWLGFGAIEFFIEDPATGKFMVIHIVEYSNANTRPSIDNPVLHLYAGSINTSNTSNITLNIGSMMGAIEGKENELGLRHGLKGSTVLTGVATETPIISIRNKLVYQNTINRTKAKIFLVSASAEHTKPVAINFYANPVLTGSSFTPFNNNISILESDVSATAFSGGIFLFSLDLGKEGQQTISIPHFQSGQLFPGDVITATAEPSSGNNAEATTSFNIVELF